MKQFLILAIFFSSIISCNKNATIETSSSSYLANVKYLLKDSIDHTAYEALDFSHAIRTNIKGKTSFLRIPFKGKFLKDEFLFLETNEQGIIKRGGMIFFDRYSLSTQRMSNYRPFNGHIVIKSLKGEKLIDSEIENGYIIAFHPKRKSHRLAIVPVEPYYTELPEVVVVSSHTQEGGIYFSDWFSFTSIYSDTYNSSSYYVSMDGYGSGGGDVSYTSGENNYLLKPKSPYDNSSNTVYEEPPVLIDYESAAFDPAIDLQKYLNCFTLIPDEGATCSIQIFADIPVDSDPGKLLNWQTGSPGHSFIQVNKSNGGKMVSQNIGFYPDEGWKVSLTNAPVDGKFVNNGGHEFNASFKMDIKPGQLRSALIEIQYLAKFIKYDIDEYNCTDFALDVFNKVRSVPLQIPLYAIPGGMTAGGTRTPQGLYNLLKAMQRSGGPEASNIIVTNSKAWVSNSTGPCN
jgi:hypothetical protein